MPLTRDSLLINKLSLDDELVRRADLVFEAGMAAAHANSEADAAKNDIKNLEAELAGEVRVALEKKANGVRTTDAQVAAGVGAHDKMVKAKARLIRKQKDAGEAEAMLDAVRDRSYAISDLCKLHASQYFSSDSVREPQEVVDTKKRKK